MHSNAIISVAPDKLPRSTLTRLCRDYKELMKHPIAGANATPMSSTNMAVWKAVVSGAKGSPMEGVSVYFGLEFPAEYPAKPPYAYFISPIVNKGGAYEADPKGRIVICNSLFGNYYNLHSDWGAGTGTGWSSSYTVSTILIQMTELISAGLLISNSKSQVETIKKAVIPEEYLIDIPEPTIISKHLTDEEVKTMDTEIKGPVCYALHGSHKETFLGVCIQGKSIYHGEYLSYEAYKNGVKSTSRDKLFSTWLPMYINPDHWSKNHKYLTEIFKSKTPSEIITMYAEPFIQTVYTFFTIKPKKISSSLIETLMIYYRTMKQLVLENSLDDEFEGELIMFLESNDVAIMESCEKANATIFILNKLLAMLFSDKFGWRETGLRIEILVCEWNTKKTETPTAIPYQELLKMGELLEVIKNYPIEWIDQNFGVVDTSTMKTINDIL